MFQQFRNYDKQCQMQPFETGPSHTDICPIMHVGFDVFDFINRMFSLKLFPLSDPRWKYVHNETQCPLFFVSKLTQPSMFSYTHKFIETLYIAQCCSVGKVSTSTISM